MWMIYTLGLGEWSVMVECGVCVWCGLWCVVWFVVWCVCVCGVWSGGVQSVVCVWCGMVCGVVCCGGCEANQ